MKSLEKGPIVKDQYHWHGGRLFRIQLISLFCLLFCSVSYGTNYYVATSGNDANDGLSEKTSWRTMAYASSKAMAGDIVYIKAGLYTGDPMSVKNSGTESAPIIFKGYTTSPGLTPNPNYVPGDTLDYNIIPVLMGTNYKGTGIDIDTRGGRIGYIEIHNMGISKYQDGIAPQFQDTKPGYAHHILIDSVYITDEGDNGMNFRDADNITIRNCVVANAQMVNIFLDITHNSLIENCTTYATYNAPAWIVTDYHICLQDAHNNIVRNCVARNMHDSMTLIHPGHGIGIKDRVYHWTDDYYFAHSYNNKIIDCATYHMGENFFVSHESYNNEFINCTSTAHYANQYYWSEGIVIRDGAHDNTFRNCRVTGSRITLVIRDEPGEGPGAYGSGARPQICRRNTIENCSFTNSSTAIEIGNADSSLIKNCVFNAAAIVLVQVTNALSFTGNICRNSIVTNISGGYQSDWGSGDRLPFVYSNFLNNSFWGASPNMPPGIGNMEKDPLFADAENGDYHLKSAYGRWNGSAWVMDTVTSPCIDAGNPTDDYSAEPVPNGNRINIGVYGGTSQASKSLPTSLGYTEGNSNTQEVSIYPIPFSNSTTIKYFATSTGHIKIIVYDIQGKQIRILLDGQIQQGSQSIQWDGNNSVGQKVKSGIYFFQLHTKSGLIKTQKIILSR